MRSRLALALLLLLLSPAAATARGTGMHETLGRALEGWAREVQAGRGSEAALEECAAGRFPEALQRARQDGDAFGAALLEVPVLLEQEPGTGLGAGLVRVCGVLEGRVEPLLVAWLRYHAGLDLAGSGRVAEAAAQLESSVALFRRGGGPGPLADALKQLAGAQLLAGRAARAAESYAEAGALQHGLGQLEEEALLAGMRARALADLGQLAEAARLYRESLPVLERAGQEQRFFSGRCDLATVRMRQGRYAEAEAELEAALRHFERTGPRALAVSVRINRAALDLERGRLVEAERRLREGLEEALEPDQEAVVRFNLAQVLVEQGRYAEAEGLLLALAEAHAARGAESAVAASWSALASLYRQQKRLAEAEAAFGKARAIHQRLGNPAGEAGALTGLGNLRLDQARPAEAEEFFRQALALDEAMGAEAAIASCRHNLTGALMALGRYEAALQSIELARAAFDRLGHRTGLAASTFKLAIMRLTLGQRKEGMALLDRVEGLYREEGQERALLDVERVRASLEAESDPAAAEARLERVARGLVSLDVPRGVASIHGALAELALARGEVQRAERLAGETLAGLQEQDLPVERLSARMTLAGIAAIQGRLEEAAGLYGAIREEAGQRGLVMFEAFAAGARARVELLAGNLEEAERAARVCEAAGDALQKDLFYAGGEGAATVTFLPFQGTVARIQMALGRPDRAFEALERGRGRLLEVARLRTMAAARSPQARALLERVREAQARVLQARDALSRARPEERVALGEDLERRVQERDRLEVELTRATRTWDQLRDPTAKAVREALPERAALLEFAFTDEGLLVYLLTRDGLSRTTLSPLSAPASVADDLLPKRVEARIRECGRTVGADRLVSQILEGSPEGAQAEARRLWDALLGPLEGRLAGIDRLLIVPDGDLHFLPFEALQDPQGRWLLERFTVTYLNTARELFLPPARTTGGAIVVGGPSYGEMVGAGEEVCRLGGPWSELPGARREAEAVASLEGVAATTGEAASEGSVKEAISRSGLVHLATHGFVGTGSPPALMSRKPQDVLRDCGLVLAGANTGGDGRDDGILTAHEVLTLDLGDTGLVVLSACDTGRGEVSAYEGVFGLKRSFLAAGARQVVFSLWAVSDSGTRALMTRFYQHLQARKPPSEALRAARLELLRGDPVLLEEGLAEEPEQFQSPFFWAPFALVGRPD